MVPFDSTAADRIGPHRETAGVDPVPGRAPMPSPSDEPSRARPWLVRVTTTLAAWLVAFSVVMTLLTLFGPQLASLPPALRALAISGVLVLLMANVVMPALNVAVARWMAGHPPHERLRELAGGLEGAAAPLAQGHSRKVHSEPQHGWVPVVRYTSGGELASASTLPSGVSPRSTH